MSSPSEPKRQRRLLPRHLYNLTSLFGLFIAGVSLFAIGFLFVLDLTATTPSPYLGIIAFAVLPVPLVVGLVLVPIGMWRSWRRERKSGPRERPLPVLDLNDPPERRAVFIFVGGTVVFLMLTAAGSFKAYEYTDSVQFCGTVCHTVMEPEYTTYQVSPHARVPCVDCHIGSGATWFVRSKLSGVYQIYSVTFDKYPRPIPTPITNLRPAPETCEQCHWPAKFQGDQVWDAIRYRADEANTPWPLRLILATGGADRSGHVHGIHWHIAQRLTYVPATPNRQEIREVRWHRADGSVAVYTNSESQAEKDGTGGTAALAERTMDCMDCHNRPSHQLRSPRDAMDEALAVGLVPRDLPFIKREGTALLAAEYPTRAAGLDAIATGLARYYGESQPEVARSRADDIARAVRGIQRQFSTYFFPYMRARWSAYPVNIGHLNNPGCFRCHGTLTGADSAVISRDCNLCHTIASQGPAGTSAMAPAGGAAAPEFVHPGGDEDWRETACSDCHDGGAY